MIYTCARCGGAILTASNNPNDAFGAAVEEQYPKGQRIADEIPDRAKAFLVQAQDTMHAPAAAVLMACSAVDAMLKAKRLTNGTLYERIDQATTDRIITPEMGAWAHDIRLDANDVRHADESAPLPTDNDAQRVLDFALALAEYLFVLPDRVKRGRRQPS